MAALDDIVTPVTTSGNATSLTVTFASAPAAGELILLQYVAQNQNITSTPAGFTVLDSSSYGGRVTVLAKVAGAFEGTTYTADFAASTNCSAIGRRIEGPFTDLSTLTYSGELSTYSTSIRILDTDVSVSANTKVIAIFATSEATDAFSSASNSFGNLAEVVAGAARCIQVHRLYASSATDVHTTLTLTNSGYGRETLLRIAAPGGGSAKFRPYFITG
jgi:hypothetical protein